MTGGLALLERAISYMLGSLALVTPETMGRATPCRGWMLGDLLAHMDNGIAALSEAAELGETRLEPTDSTQPIGSPQPLYPPDPGGPAEPFNPPTPPNPLGPPDPFGPPGPGGPPDPAGPPLPFSPPGPFGATGSSYPQGPAESFDAEGSPYPFNAPETPDGSLYPFNAAEGSPYPLNAPDGAKDSLYPFSDPDDAVRASQPLPPAEQPSPPEQPDPVNPPSPFTPPDQPAPNGPPGPFAPPGRPDPAGPPAPPEQPDPAGPPNPFTPPGPFGPGGPPDPFAPPGQPHTPDQPDPFQPPSPLTPENPAEPVRSADEVRRRPGRHRAPEPPLPASWPSLSPVREPSPFDQELPADSRPTPGQDGTAAPVWPGNQPDPVNAIRLRAGRLLGEWARADEQGVVTVDGCPLTAMTVAAVGAVEIAVHGWDVAKACGWDRPLPEGLASELLDLVPVLVHEEDRPARFGAKVQVRPGVSKSEELLAYLGRRSRMS